VHVQGWCESDGGCLRFYRTSLEDETGEACSEEDYTDVAPLAVRKTPLFFGVLPMFVPSLSWQNDRFHI